MEEMNFHRNDDHINFSTMSTPDSYASSSSSYCRTNSAISTLSGPTVITSDSDDASPIRWTPPPLPPPRSTIPTASPSRLGMTKYMRRCGNNKDDDDDDELDPVDFELEVMRERFSKLLLGEDMSGGGKGVCTAVTISNAITNLYATVFGNSQRLEPLRPAEKMMWTREMDCLLSVCDYIVELVPDLEVMSTRQRPDIQLNLPALKKLDGMLVDILDSFHVTEFWYTDQNNITPNHTPTSPTNDNKWWHPVPCIPTTGLSDQTRKHLRHQRDCASQIHKAAMAINSNILNEMEIPESYIISLPKSGKSCLGDSIYKYMHNAELFQPDHVLDSLKIASEHEALELADRVEACMHTWRRKSSGGMNRSRSAWNLKRESPDRSDKNCMLAERAETLLFFLKHRYPELSQTTLDTCKILYNRDVGQAIMESYSRVLEGLAYNIVAWINDVISADKLMKNQQQQGHL